MATKLPSGKYRTQVYIGGEGKRRYKSFIGNTSREADMLAEQFKREHGADVRIMTLSKAADAFLSDVGNSLSPNTLRGYTGILRTLKKELPRLMRTDIYKLTKKDVQAVARLDKSPKTIYNYIGFLSAALSYHDVKLPHITLPERPNTDVYIPDEETVRQVIEAARGTNLEVPVALAARGMRCGEIHAVTADDLDGNLLHIKSSMAYTGNGYVRKTPKTKMSDRYILIPDDIAKKIREEGRATHMTGGAISCAFRRFLKRNDFPKFRFHDLRHAFVSIAHANGVPDSYIMSMGGWSTPQTMQRVYRHSLDAELKKYQEKMDDILS